VKTYVANSTTAERNWLVVDANGQTLGRLATQLADALRGKRKPEYTPHVDTGDFVIVINAEKISVTGNKRAEKLYYLTKLKVYAGAEHPHAAQQPQPLEIKS
jgi:large subunit ribosomal protein L13